MSEQVTPLSKTFVGCYNFRWKTKPFIFRKSNVSFITLAAISTLTHIHLPCLGVNTELISGQSFSYISIVFKFLHTKIMQMLHDCSKLHSNAQEVGKYCEKKNVRLEIGKTAKQTSNKNKRKTNIWLLKL